MNEFAYNEAKMMEGILAFQRAYQPPTHPPRRVTRLQPSERRRINAIAWHVASAFGLAADDLRSSSHSQKYVFPRQIAIYLIREIIGASYPQLGRIFNKHHSTAIASIEVIVRRMKAEPEVARLVGALHREIFT